MKYVLIFIFTFFTGNCFAQDYLLTDENSNKTYLADFINDLITENKITNNPVLVVNKKILKKDEIRNLNFQKSDISNISVVSKDNTETVEMYGQESLNGVIVIETKSLQEKNPFLLSNNNILFLFDGKQISQKELEMINPDNIKSVVVVKDKAEFSKYTFEDVDGIVIIEMKNQD